MMKERTGQSYINIQSGKHYDLSFIWYPGSDTCCLYRMLDEYLASMILQDCDAMVDQFLACQSMLDGYTSQEDIAYTIACIRELFG